MKAEEIFTLKRRIEHMREEVAEFSDEFATLSAADLEKLHDEQQDIADAATYKADAALTEIKLRALKGILS